MDGALRMDEGALRMEDGPLLIEGAERIDEPREAPVGFCPPPRCAFANCGNAKKEATNKAVKHLNFLVLRNMVVLLRRC